MKKTLVTLLLCSLLATTLQAAGQRLIKLFGMPINAETTEILLPDEAIPSEFRAAEELQKFLQEMTGSKLEIKLESEPTAGRRVILVGHCLTAAKYGFEVDYDKLGLEGIRIESNEASKALLLGGNRRGCLYAVYDFLEEELGCHWFAKDCSVIPGNAETVELDTIQKEFIPALEQRDANYTCCYDVPTSVRNKLNGAAVGADASWGNHVRYKHLVHTFDLLCPVATYGATHPEYYSEVNGERLLKHTQLCLTNPEVLKIVTEATLKQIEETDDDVIISVSQNDNKNYCQCEKCMALAEQEESQCGPLLAFVNAVAAEVEKRHPGRIIDTLAYQYTRKPPKNIKPLPNVAVRLCSIECCFSHSLEECPINATFVQDIKDWNAICDRLHIWDYVINYAHNNMPFANFNVLKPNIQFFINNGVTSIFEEANYYSDHGEFAELRSYVMFKLLWDPSYDTAKAIYDFTEAYYGPAGQYIRLYLFMLHDWVCNQPGIHMDIYKGPEYYLNDMDKLNLASELFKKAMNAVKDDPVRLLRVQTEYLSVIYAKGTLASTALLLKDGVLVAQETDANQEIDLFAEVARKVGIARMGEGTSNTTESWIAEHSSATNPHKVYTIQKDGAVLDILPSLGGRIWRANLIGHDVMLVSGDENQGFAPAVNGWEEYSTSGYRSEGFVTPYQVVSQSESAIELKAVLSTGAVSHRTIEVLDKASFRVVSWYDNPDGTPSTKQFRIHPAFEVPAPTAAVMRTYDANGKATELPIASKFPVLNDGQMPKEIEVYCEGASKPAGHWELDYTAKDGKPVTLVHEFPADQADFTYLNANRIQNRVNLELWTKGGKLENTYKLIER